MAEQQDSQKYPLLEEMLTLRGMRLQATFTNGDLGQLFDVSVRAIQDRVATGQLVSRDLPGRAKFLPIDVEEFLRNSRKSRKRRDK